MKDKRQEADGEYWFPAYGFPLYECSNTGKVRNVETKNQLKRYGKNSAVILTRISESGMAKKHKMTLARLVYQSFHKKKVPQGYFVHRMNGIDNDNHIANLKLISPSERGKLSGKKRQKPVDHYDTNGNLIATYKSRTAAAKALYIDRTTVNNIISGKDNTFGFVLKNAKNRDI